MNPATSPSTTTKESAPYGRACAGCARAKCRCILRSDTPTCERCHRLRKECLPSPIIRKKVTKRPAGGNRRTAELEDKLDSLVTLLKSQATSTSKTDSGISEGGGDTTSASELSPNDGVSQGSRPGPGPGAIDRHDVGIGPVPYAASFYPQPVKSGRPLPPGPSPAEAERYLEEFKQTRIYHFPFIIFSPDMTAAKLQVEYPFLWLNVRANSCKNTIERRQIEMRIREIASQKLLVDLERSMDLLLGLISYLSWTTEKFQGKPILSLFSHICLSLVSDLRIDRRVQELPCRELNAWPKAFSEPLKVQHHPERTHHERRLLLGTFIQCSTTSWFLKASPTTWTPHMEDCTRDLMANPETDSDLVLVLQARISRLLGDINLAGSWRPSEAIPTQTAFPPSLMHVKGLRAALKDIISTTPPDILAQRRVKSYTLIAEAMINELPLYPLDPSIPSPATVDFERTECFYTCLQAIKACLDNFFSWTPYEMNGLTMAVHLHFSRCTHILYRLSLMDDPAWDRGAISASINLLDTLERCAEAYDAIPPAMGIDTDGTDVYTRVAEVLRNTVPLWRRALEDAGAIQPAQGQQVSEPLPGQELATMDISVDGWFTDIFSIVDPF